MDVSNLNYLLALGTVATQIITVALLVVFLLRKKVPLCDDIAAQVGSFGVWAAFLVSLVASGMTLYYERLGFEPCPLCWWQRIFMYPQVMLFGMAAWCGKYRQTAIDASIAFSVLGGAVALYHHALQMLPGSGLPCPATGVSCAQRLFFEFGYVTYPLMAASVFAFVIVALLLVRAKSPESM
jgi:disulfide bond formation protein DsbB